MKRGLILTGIIIAISLTGSAAYISYKNANQPKISQPANAKTPQVSVAPTVAPSASAPASPVLSHAASRAAVSAPVVPKITSLQMSTPQLGQGRTGPPVQKSYYWCTFYATATFNQPATSISYNLIEINSQTGASIYLAKNQTDQLNTQPKGPSPNSYQLDLFGWGEVTADKPYPRRWVVEITSPNQISAQTIDTTACYVPN